MKSHHTGATAPDPHLVPPILTVWLSVFRPCFTAPVWKRVLVLVAGAVPAPGQRTVTAVLRVMGLEGDHHFRRYHEVLSRARWDPLAIARKLLLSIIERLLPEGEVVIGIDNTIERRWAPRLRRAAFIANRCGRPRDTLDKLIKTQGWTSAAARVAADPGQLSGLRGKEGLFVGAKARAEPEGALRAAGAIGPSLERIGAAEAAAERSYGARVAQPRAADATGIPRLPAAAETAIGAVSAAEGRGRGSVWRAVLADDPLAGELRAFGEAVERRFGAEAVRAMQQSEGWAGAVADPSIAPDQPAMLDRVATLTAGLKAGQRAAEAITQREAETARRRLRL